jgi:hypothetical protein
MRPVSLINQPVHFFSALLVIGSFVTVMFTHNDTIKKYARNLLFLGYALILISGGILFAKLPFSIFVLIKSVGGVGLVIMAEILRRRLAGRNTIVIWALMLATAVIGLTIAYCFISPTL